jgi:hypothetical protein
MTIEQDQKIELTRQQTNPYLARPEDFTISEPDEIASRPTPFHGQCGDTQREYKRLLAIRHAKNKGVDLPLHTDDAGPPQIGKRY